MVSEVKLKEVERLERLISSHRTIGIADVSNFSSRSLQELRKKLKDKTKLMIAKNSLIAKAFERKNLQRLKEFLGKTSCIIASNLGALELFKELKKAKALEEPRKGEVLDLDLEIFEGPTGMMAGPALAMFRKLGLQVRVKEKEIEIAKTKVIAKKGEKVSEELAYLARKLRLKAKVRWLEPKVLWENGLIYPVEILVEDLEGNLSIAFVRSLNLAKILVYPTCLTLPYILNFGFQNALSLSLSLGYPTRKNIEFLLRKAYLISKSLKI